uniref:Zinc ribbon domain-containing protein n=1 Tax=Eiseniibacteriota bacterium TaxID=2212470 RepID=A0A832I0M3_UNCEI
MPLYDFACARCGRRFEALVNRWDDPAPQCPACGAAGARRLLSTFAVAGRARPEPGPCGAGDCVCRSRRDE